MVATGSPEATEALELLDSLKTMAQQRYVNPRSFVQIYLGLDSLDTAMDWMIEAAKITGITPPVLMRSGR